MVIKCGIPDHICEPANDALLFIYVLLLHQACS